mmetsp:Transcript_34101/g.73902  ORF Transcript_34101/g.73902 Transcript_34101/m.73902 type:complete len:95 (-) Transcript_34101:223-507(-)
MRCSTRRATCRSRSTLLRSKMRCRTQIALMHVMMLRLNAVARANGRFAGTSSNSTVSSPRFPAAAAFIIHRPKTTSTSTGSAIQRTRRQTYASK